MTLSLCFSHLLSCLQRFCATDYSGHAAKQGPFRTKMPLPTKPAHGFWLYTGSQGQNLDWTGSICIGAFVFFSCFALFSWALNTGTSNSPNNPSDITFQWVMGRAGWGRAGKERSWDCVSSNNLKKMGYVFGYVKRRLHPLPPTTEHHSFGKHPHGSRGFYLPGFPQIWPGWH